jgi:hypothetical protein
VVQQAGQWVGELPDNWLDELKAAVFEVPDDWTPNKTEDVP